MANPCLRDTLVLWHVPPASWLGHGAVVWLVCARCCTVFAAILVHHCVWLVCHLDPVEYWEHSCCCTGPLPLQCDGTPTLPPHGQIQSLFVCYWSGFVLADRPQGAVADCTQRILVGSSASVSLSITDFDLLPGLYCIRHL
jgi:hypothetical protein